MMIETTSMKQTWQLLWCHAAYQSMAACPVSSAFERVTAGYGWGLRDRADRRRALLIHPSGAGRALGELSLTILGTGTQVIPRCNRSYPAYLAAVTAAIATALE